jgi:hypothetical protein
MNSVIYVNPLLHRNTRKYIPLLSSGNLAGILIKNVKE